MASKICTSGGLQQQTRWSKDDFTKESGFPVTIIATIWEDDSSILIAADSGMTDMPGEIRSIYPYKLQSHPTAPLTWGIAGNPTIGIHRFGEWLKEYQWPPQDLTVLQDELALKLAELNGKQREVMEVAGVEAKEDDLCSALVVGWLTTPFAFEIDDQGQVTFIGKDTEFHAIGSGSPHAKLIHAAYAEEQVKLDVSTQDKLKLILTIAARKARDCDPPIHVWIIKDGTVEKPASPK